MTEAKFTKAELAKYFDHTALKPETTEQDIRMLCADAAKWNTAAVCINPVWIPLASKLLKGTTVMPITVVGFPLGATGTQTKVYEAREAISKGAQEIDMVLSIGEFKSGKHDVVRRDIVEVMKACRDIPLKVIFETSMLSGEDIRLIATWCAEDGVAFVKTSTGFSGRGASVEDIQIMKAAIDSVSGSPTWIKASGGIRNLNDTLALIHAGASRIGASATGSILKELEGAQALVGSGNY